MKSNSEFSLIWHERPKWEVDFIRQELLPTPRNIYSLNERGLAAYSNENPDLPLVICFSSVSIDYDLIKLLVLSRRPDILINLSDEHYPGMRPEINDLGMYASLYLRQYRQPSYSYSASTSFLGLGFGSGMLSKTERSWNLLLKPVRDRELTWAFVGTLKQDRREMLTSFNRIDGGASFTHGLPIKEMRRIYENSIFVPVGMGNSTLECFRIYEAIILGCIPVVVGPNRMVKETLFHLGMPPYIVEQSWLSAVEKCKTLLKMPETLSYMQQECLNYWKRHVISVRQLSRSYLKVI